MASLSTPLKIAVLGGAGALGSGLARRWAKAGHQVVIGSRDPDRAQGVVDTINGAYGPDRASAATYRDAAGAADIIVLTVPFASQRDVLGHIQDLVGDKVVVDCTVPLKPPKVSTVQLPPEGSAAQVARVVLGPDARIVSAFQNVGAALLAKDDDIECDVLVCSDDPVARALGVELVQAAGLQGYEAGPLANAAAAEALTSLLIHINRRYKADHAGIRLTGLSGQAHHA